MARNRIHNYHDRLKAKVTEQLRKEVRRMRRIRVKAISRPALHSNLKGA